MPKRDYAAFRALDLFFAVVMEGLSMFVNGEHYFDTLDDDVLFEILATDTPYDNRFVSIATIENRKIVRWRDYMDSLAAWRALNAAIWNEAT